MPLFIIEREFAEQLDVDDDPVRSIEGINDEAARRANLPSNVVMEVTPLHGQVPASRVSAKPDPYARPR
jgi:hypothetical protein